MAPGSLALAAVCAANAASADPLPSWNDTGPKRAIVSFVEKVTQQGGTDFVPVSERIAVFVNPTWGSWTKRSTKRSQGVGPCWT
jgi:hypothetical protein